MIFNSGAVWKDTQLIWTAAQDASKAQPWRQGKSMRGPWCFLNEAEKVLDNGQRNHCCRRVDTHGNRVISREGAEPVGIKPDPQTLTTSEVTHDGD